MSVLSDDELRALVFAVLASGQRDSEVIGRIVQWAEKTRMGGELLALALQGKVTAEWDDAQETVRFKLTAAERRGRPDA